MVTARARSLASRGGGRAHAIVFAGENRVEIREIRVPPLGPTEVLIRTEFSGISVGTDRGMVTGRYGMARERYPFVYGYLRVGTVEACGAQVTAITAGDRVFAGLSGCRLDPQDGLSAAGGAYTSVGVAQESDVYLLPPSVKREEAALLGLAAVSRVGVRLSGVREGDLVVVVGQGMIGQMAGQLCRARGACVVATDLLESRRHIAERWSADAVASPDAGALEAAVRRARATLGDPHGYGPAGAGQSAYERHRWTEIDGGADVVIETAGRRELIAPCLGLLRREGRLCLQGYIPEELGLRYHEPHRRRATLIFPGGFDLSDYDACLALLEDRRLTIGPLISHVMPVRQAVEAFRLIVEEPEKVLGMVLDWR